MGCKKCKKKKPLLSDKFNSTTEDIRKNLSSGILGDTFGEFSFLETFCLIAFGIVPILVGYVAIVRFFITLL